VRYDPRHRNVTVQSGVLGIVSTSGVPFSDAVLQNALVSLAPDARSRLIAEFAISASAKTRGIEKSTKAANEIISFALDDDDSA